MKLDREAVLAINEWNAANKRSRMSYQANPTVTANKPMRWITCAGDCGNEILVEASRITGQCKKCYDAQRWQEKKLGSK